MMYSNPLITQNLILQVMEERLERYREPTPKPQTSELYLKTRREASTKGRRKDFRLNR